MPPLEIDWPSAFGGLFAGVVLTLAAVLALIIGFITTFREAPEAEYPPPDPEWAANENDAEVTPERDPAA